jgi:2-hydroxy-3-keto-5-methylthiopentenyl-1-phosphate phosphatase
VPELAAWLAGTLGHRELTRAQCARLRVREPEALEFARGFRLDPRFTPFAREALGRGDAVMIVSEGFDFYVRDHLQREGLGDLPWAANRLVFKDDGSVEPEFPFADPACAECGNCKAQHVRRYRSRGYHTVLVGDGTSDRHGALAADAVLARGSLLDWCRAEGVPHRAFQDFGDVAEYARRQEQLATRGARGGRP